MFNVEIVLVLDLNLDLGPDLELDNNINHLGKTSKKKMCIFHDNLQIGWGGYRLKTHFKKY